MARNEFGQPLDRNGYAPSILQDETKLNCCYLCMAPLAARHEVFGGPYRPKSKRLGLWLYLCPKHHAEAHKYAKKAAAMKRMAQRVAMAKYNWKTEDFILQFGKNYQEG